MNDYWKGKRVIVTGGAEFARLPHGRGAEKRGDSKVLFQGLTLALLKKAFVIK